LKRIVLARPAVLSGNERLFVSRLTHAPRVATMDIGPPSHDPDMTLGQVDLRTFSHRHRPSGFAVTRARMIRGTGKVAKKKISWEASPSPSVVGYRVYWSVGKRVTYESPFVDVGHSTSFVLPDDVPSFPLIAGRIELGVTSVSRSGNESEMVVLSTLFDFTKPRAPMGVKLENG
jgi:hypothetical protein